MPFLIFYLLKVLSPSDSKESACNTADAGSMPGLGRSPGEGNGHLLQYSCLENSKDRGAWRAVVQGVARSQTQLSTGGDKIEPDSQAQSTD